MKRISLFFLFALLFPLVGCAQSPWLFNSIDSVYGHVVYISRVNYDIAKELRKTALIKEEKKYKKFSRVIDQKKMLYDIESHSYTVSYPITIKKKQYLCLKGDTCILYIPIKVIEKLLPNYLISIDYLNNKFNYYRTNYAYLNITQPGQLNALDKKAIGYKNRSNILSDLILGKFTKVKWISYAPNNMYMPMYVNVVFVDDTVAVRCLDIEKYAKSELFISQIQMDTLLKYEEERKLTERRRQDSIRMELERRDSILSSHNYWAVAKKQNTIVSLLTNETVQVNSGDSIPIYAYYNRKKSLVGYYKSAIVCLTPQYGTYDSWVSENYTIGGDVLSFFIRRCTDMTNSRKEWARIDDSLRIERDIKDMYRRIDSVNRYIDSTRKAYRQKQIFITNQDYVYAEYGGRFGLKWTFYNCFGKTIKYIQITVKSYNQVDDIQRDDLGRSEASAKCIGPIEPGDFGTYSFDNLFWDDNDVIRYLRPTYIKITFKDNSTKCYSGWDNIKKRMVKYYQ